MTQNLKDLKEGTSDVEALLTEKRVATAKNGKQYADLVFSDKTGILKCKRWDYKEYDNLTVGGVYKLDLDITTYQGELQGTIKQYLVLTKDPKDFVKGSRFDIETMYSEVMARIDKFSEPMTKYIASKLMEGFRESIKRAPAAKAQHNAWSGGLLEHIWSMCSYAETVVQHYQKSYGSKISLDKVIFGLCVHDLGKVVEYTYEAGIGYAPRGVLTPHIVLGPCWVYELANKWYKETIPGSGKMPVAEFERERDHLMHILAAHHGKGEWGSPVVPSTLEAVLVHQFDMVDSKFMHAMELVEGKEGQIPGFSEKSWSEKTQYLQYN